MMGYLDQMRFTLIWLLLLPLLSGCMYYEHRFLKEEYRTEPVIIPHKLGKVIVVDRRKNVSDHNLVLPIFGFNFKTEAINAPLTQEEIDVIKAELPQYFSGGNESLDAVVEVLAGEKKYSVEFAGLHEVGRAKLKITLSEAATDEPIEYGLGSAQLEFRTKSSSDKFFEQLYQKSLKSAVFQAVNAIASQQ